MKKMLLSVIFFICGLVLFSACKDVKRYESPQNTIDEYIKAYTLQHKRDVLECLDKDFIFEFVPYTTSKNHFYINYLEEEKLMHLLFFNTVNVKFIVSPLKHLSDNTYSARYEFSANLCVMKKIPDSIFDSAGTLTFKLVRKGGKYLINRLIEQPDAFSEPGLARASIGFLHIINPNDFSAETEENIYDSKEMQKYEVYLPGEGPPSDNTKIKSVTKYIGIYKPTNEILYIRAYVNYDGAGSDEKYFDRYGNRISNIIKF